MHWINNIEKRETVEICVSRVDSPDPMLTHEDGRPRIKDQVTPDVWDFGEDLRGNSLVPLCRNQGRETGVGEHRFNEQP